MAYFGQNPHFRTRKGGRPAKDAVDRWWEWVERRSDSPLTIPAYPHDAVMQLPPEDRLNRVKVSELVHLADAQP